MVTHTTFFVLALLASWRLLFDGLARGADPR
jgi:hypothetical protein